MKVNRRFLLKSMGVSAGAWMLSPFLSTPLLADPKKPVRNFVFCYFSGGWDTLLCLDPRDPGKFTESRVKDTKIELAWDRLQAPFKPDIIQPKGSKIEFGPAIGSFAKHFDKSCVVRGVAMDTVSHGAGRRYFLTGKMPQGEAALGSSVATWVVRDQGEVTPIPNLVVGVETYNRGLPAWASGLKVSSVTDLQATLRDGPQAPDQTVRKILEQYRSDYSNCDPVNLDHAGLFRLIRNEQKKARILVSGGLLEYFNFNSNKPEMVALRKRYGITSSNSGATQAAMAFQALKHQVAQCVTIRLSGGLDTHGANWSSEQPERLQSGFQALSTLIDDLSANDHPQGGKLLDHTTVVVFSEFGRTPRLNSNGGRDHAITSSCLLIGAGVPHNRVIGASSDVGMNPMAINPNTGYAEAGGVQITPPRIMSSLLKGAGYQIDQFRTGALPCLIKA